MRAVGVDIASQGFLAMALAVDGIPQRAVIWKPEDKKDSDPERLYRTYIWMARQLALMKPNIVSVEQQAGYVNNGNVIRSLSRREGVALLAAKQRRGVVVLNPTVKQARGVVFRNGSLSKDDAWEAIKRMFPEFDFGRKTTGGTDKADALVHALAAPTILERR